MSAWVHKVSFVFGEIIDDRLRRIDLVSCKGICTGMLALKSFGPDTCQNDEDSSTNLNMISLGISVY